MRRPLTPAVPGAALAVASLLWALDAVLSGGASYHGVPLDGAGEAGAALRGGLLLAEGKVALLYLLFGLVLAVMPRALLPPRARGPRLVLLVLGPAWTALFMLASACCRRPFLFEPTVGASPALGWLLETASSLGSPGLYLAAAGLPWLVPASSWAFRHRRPAAVLGVITAVLAAAAVRDSASSASPGRPPVILVGIDSLRSDMLDEEAGAAPLLPNLRRLREESLCFPRAFVPLARTFPSLVTLLASAPPSEHGVRHMFPRLEELGLPEETLPRVLGRAGWRTAALADYAGDALVSADLGFGRAEAPRFDLPGVLDCLGLARHPFALALAGLPGGRRLFPGVGVYGGFTESRRLTRRAVSFLREGGAAPCILVFYTGGHYPYAAAYPWYRAPLPGQAAAGGSGGPFGLARPLLDPAGASPGEAATAGALYRRSLLEADAELGILRQACLEAGLWDRSLVVVFSDHGEWLGEDGLGFGHGDHLFGERDQIVPLILKLPGGEMAGREVPERVSIMDVAPTVAEALGVPVPRSWKGTGLLSLARRGEAPPTRDLAGETGIWFDPLARPPGAGRMRYPGIVSLLEADGRGRLVLRREWGEAVEVAKHRCLLTGGGKVVYAPFAGSGHFWWEPPDGRGGWGQRVSVEDPAYPPIRALRERMRAEGFAPAGSVHVPAGRLKGG